MFFVINNSAWIALFPSKFPLLCLQFFIGSKDFIFYDTFSKP